MAHREVKITRTGRYGTRMLTAGERITVSGPEARALIALKRAKEVAEPVRQEAKPAEFTEADELTDLRAEYRKKIGKQPYHGWEAGTLREKIAEA